MEVHREQLPLNEVGLRRLAQTDGDVGLAHGEVELLVGGEQRDMDIGIKIGELAKAWRQPVHADAGRGRHAQIAVRPVPAVGKLGARRFELHEHFMRGAIEHFALLGQDQAAGVPMKQRDRQFLLERADLARHGGLRQPELLAGMREAACLGGGVKYFELVPIHLHAFFLSQHMARGENYSAAMRGSASPCAARNFSASSAAMQPRPAAVTACR